MRKISKASAVGGHTAQLILFLLLLSGGLVMLYPLYYAFFGAVASNEEFLSAVFIPLPHRFFQGFANFGKAFADSKLIVSIGLTVGRVALMFAITGFTSVLAGYVFAKYRFPGKRVFFLLFLSSLMIPSTALLVPQYIWFAKFPLLGGNDLFGKGGAGLINNPWSLIITGWINVYNIFLCRQALAGIGNELAESAAMDGAGFFRTVFGIYMPLIKPILAVILLNLFLGIWNDYMNNFIFMKDVPEWHTVGNVVINIMNIYSNPTRVGGPDYPVVFAVALISMIPPIVVYGFVQKQFTEGLTMGAVKG